MFRLLYQRVKGERHHDTMEETRRSIRSKMQNQRGVAQEFGTHLEDFWDRQRLLPAGNHRNHEPGREQDREQQQWCLLKT